MQEERTTAIGEGINNDKKNLHRAGNRKCNRERADVYISHAYEEHGENVCRWGADSRRTLDPGKKSRLAERVMAPKRRMCTILTVDTTFCTNHTDPFSCLPQMNTHRTLFDELR